MDAEFRDIFELSRAHEIVIFLYVESTTFERPLTN